MYFKHNIDFQIYSQNYLELYYNINKGKQLLTFFYALKGTRSDGGILRRTIDVIFNSINKLQSMKYVFKPDRMNGFEVQSEADAMLDRQRIDVMKSSRRYARYSFYFLFYL